MRILVALLVTLLTLAHAEAALVLADRVNETSTTTGTGSIALEGATANHVSFNTAVGVGNTTYYGIAIRGGTDAWEIGLGTLSGATTLARTTPYATWNGATLCTSACSALSLAAGTKDVFVTEPALVIANLVALMANGTTVVADTGASNNFLTAISAAGVISKAQPAFTNISGTALFGQGGTGLTTAADDTTLVSSGSAWVATALPNCTDTGGNHINYTASTNAFSCGTSGAAATAGGSDTQVQFNDGGTTLAGAVGLTWNKTNLAVTIAGGTHTTSLPVLNTTETWNASGTTFTHEFHNVTNTASAAGSLLADWQVASVSKFKIGKGGNLILGTTVPFEINDATIGSGYWGLGGSGFTGTNYALAQLGTGGTILNGTGVSVRLNNVAQLTFSTGFATFSVQVTAPTASAGAPGYIFAGDAATGFYRVGTSIVGLNKMLGLVAVHFASLGTPAAGTVSYCDDCDPPAAGIMATCTSAGTKTGA